MTGSACSGRVWVSCETGCWWEDRGTSDACEGASPGEVDAESAPDDQRCALLRLGSQDLEVDGEAMEMHVAREVELRVAAAASVRCAGAHVHREVGLAAGAGR